MSNKLHAQPEAAPNRLDAHDTALSENARSGVELLLSLLASTVPTCPQMNAAERDRLESAVIGLLQAVTTQDGVKMMAAVQLASLNLASLDSLGRAANCGSESRARELNLRYGIKSASAFTELMKALDANDRRGGNNVNVKSVTIEPGAQAVVGNINTSGRYASRTTDQKPPPDPVPTSDAIEAKPPAKSTA